MNETKKITTKGCFLYDNENVEERNKVYFILSGFGMREHIRTEHYNSNQLKNGKLPALKTKITAHNELTESDRYKHEKAHKSGKGSIVGLGNILSRNRDHRTNLRVHEDNLLDFTSFSVPINVIKDFMKRNNKFKAKCYQTAFMEWIRCSDIDPGEFNPWGNESEKTIYDIAQKTQFREIKKGEKVTAENGGFVLAGSFKRYMNNTSKTMNVEKHYFGGGNLPPMIVPLVAKEDSILLTYSESVFELKTNHLDSTKNEWVIRDEDSKKDHKEHGNMTGVSDLSKPLGNNKAYNDFIKANLDHKNGEQEGGVAKKLVQVHNGTKFNDLRNIYMNDKANSRAIDNHYAENLFASLGKMTNDSSKKSKVDYSEGFNEENVKMMETKE